MPAVIAIYRVIRYSFWIVIDAISILQLCYYKVLYEVDDISDFLLFVCNTTYLDRFYSLKFDRLVCQCVNQKRWLWNGKKRSYRRHIEAFHDQLIIYHSTSAFTNGKCVQIGLHASQYLWQVSPSKLTQPLPPLPPCVSIWALSMNCKRSTS